MGIPLKPFVNPLAGRPLHYTPKQLAEKFGEYIAWCEQNVMEFEEEKSGWIGKSDMKESKVVTKHRLISVHGFLVYIGKTKRWWSQLSEGKQGEKFSYLKETITEYCEDYQKELAASGHYNANIISRLLGLADKKELTGESINIIVNSPEEKQELENMKDLSI